MLNEQVQPGFVGNLGPETGLKFTAQFTNTVKEHTGVRPRLMLVHPHVNEEAERQFLSANLSEASQLKVEAVFVEALAEAFTTLHQAGCTDSVALCNTIQPLVAQILQTRAFPGMDVHLMPRIVADRLAEDMNGGRVLLIGSKHTVFNKNIFGPDLKDNNFTVLKPSDTEQEEIGRIIVDLVQNHDLPMLERAVRQRQHVDFILGIVKRLRADTVLLACTDFAPHLEDVRAQGVPALESSDVMHDFFVDLVVKEP